MPMAGLYGEGFGWLCLLMVMLAAIGGVGMVVLRGRHQRLPQLSRDPLDMARERYAEGKLSKAEFEVLASDLLKTERHP